MKKTKFTAYALGLIIGVTTLSGCSDTEEKDLKYIDVGNLAAVSNPEIPPIVFNGSETETSSYTSQNTGTSDTESNIGGNVSSTESDTSSSSEALPGDNSSPKTEIEIPESGDYYLATTEIMEYDAEKVKSIIFGDATVTDNTMNYPNQAPIYIWNYEDKELYVSNDSACVDYTSDLSTSINIIFKPPADGSEGNVKKFPCIGDDLDFCTRKEAVKSVSDILMKLGICVSENVDIYALSQGDMQEVVDEECAKGRFYQFDSEWHRIPVDSYTVQKNQECYYMVFNAAWNGVPIYNETLYYMTIKDLAIFHPTITAIYSADGLAELRISEYRLISGQGEKITNLISPETAAQAVGNKYKDVVGMETISFDKMSLMYVLTPYSENGKIVSYKTNMTPAWVCTIEMTEYTYDRETGTQAPVTSHKNVLIDAQTGVEII